MADKRFNIVFNAELEIGNIKASLEQINKLVSNTALNLPKGISGNLTKTIQSIRSELIKLEGMQGLAPNAKNANAITKSYESIFTKFQSLQALMGDLGKDIKIDPKKFFPPEVINSIKQATAALDEYHKKIKEGPQSETYKNQKASLKTARRDEETANNRASSASLALKEAEALKTKYEEAAAAKKKVFEEARSKSNAAQKESKQLDEEIKKREALLQIKQKEKALAEQREIVARTKEDSKTRLREESKATNLENEINALRQYEQAVQTSGQSLEELQTKAATAKETAAIAASNAAQAEKEYQAALKNSSNNDTEMQKLTVAYQVASQQAEEAANKVRELDSAIKQAEQGHQTESFNKLIEVLGKIQGLDVSKIKSIEDINAALSSLNTDALNKIEQAFAAAGINAKDLGVDLEKLKGNVQGFEQISSSAQRAADDMSMLQSRLNYFFSSLNMINLFKRTVRQAINTVKELDAVMTETAVVTDFTVGDMWDKLPQYAAQANGLGASIKDLYAATTLYYQQGLQTNAAMGVGVETMKMARIAGMEASDATTAMTAALRGFNMEVNELNAQRVNDVYSELAAITAADTSQIATAMKKTASIASSANMEFETTAALLAQIIETTQEAPETAGTAMKTIIARFTEVKELFKEGQLTGEDEEGEIISINKIDDALKSVGISLKDFLTGSKGIDDIFLELASKWDTLDLATQRYIATTAAGSRQQSRFIAMMSNYGRTMELVDAAQNSSGASQKQFDKTLESMEAKLQKLKNAWNEFTMGLANNDILKAGVDILTGLLNAINGLTSALSGGGGFTKSLLNILTVVGALKGGRSLLGMVGILPQTGKGAQTNKILNMPKPSNTQIASEAKKTATVYGNTFQATMQQTGQKIGGWFGKTFTEETQIMTKNAYEEIDKLAERKLVMESKSKTGQVLMRSYKQGDLTEEQAADLKNIYNEYRSGAKTMEQADEAAKKYGVTMRQIEGSVKATSFNMQKFGVTVMGVGAAFSLLGSLAKELELDGLSEALSKVGSVMVSVGSTAMMLAPALKNMGVEFTNLGVAINGVVKVSAGALGIFAILLAAVIGFAMFLKNNSLEAKIGKASENVQKAEQEVDKLTEKYNSLNSTLDSISQKKDMLNNYIVGTQAWKDKVSELNQEIASLVTEYPQLGEFLQIKNGILSLDEAKTSVISGKTLQETIETYSQQLDSVTRGKYMNEIKQNKLIAKQYLNDSLGIYRATHPIVSDDSEGVEETREERIDEFYSAAGDAFAAIAEGTLSFYDGKTQDNYDALYKFMKAKGVNDANADSFATFYSEQDRSYLQSLGQKQIQNDANERAARMLLVNDNILSAGLSQENQQIMQNLDYALLANGYEKFYQAAEEIATSNEFERNKAFSRATGYDAVKGTTFVVDGKNEEFNETYVKNQAATYLADQAFQEAMNNFAQKVSNLDEVQKSNLARLLSEGGSAIDKDVLENFAVWSKKNKNLGFSDYFKQSSGLENLSLEDLKLLGFETEEDLAEQIKNNIANGLQNYTNSKKDLVKIIKKFDKSEKDIWKAVDKIDEGKQDLLLSIGDTLESIGDDQIYQAAMSQLYDGIETITVENLEAIDELVGSINWNNPIEAVSRLQQAANSANKEIASFAQSLLKLNSTKIGISAQFNQLINSEDFSELNEEMAKLIEQNNKIDSSNINEWRKECSSLNKMMKQTGLTAEGMAKALTMLQTEELKLSQMTNTVLAAFTAFDGVGDIIYKTLDSIQNFDMGLDEGEVVDFINQSYETLQEHIDAGEWGNSQNRSILEFIFGSDALKKDGEYLEGIEYAQAIKDYTKFLKSNSKNMGTAWRDLASGKFMDEKISGIEGFEKLASGQGVQLKEGLELLKLQNGGVELKGYENFTVPELMSILAEYTGSEQLANMMFTDLANASTDIQDYKASWDYEQGMAAVKDNMRVSSAGEITDINGWRTTEELRYDPTARETEKSGSGRFTTVTGTQDIQSAVGSQIGVIDESEIQAIAKAYNKYDWEIEQSLGVKGTDYKVTQFYDNKGNLKSNADLQTNIETVFGKNWIDLYSTKFKDSITGEIESAEIDYDKLMSGLDEIGIPSQAQEGLALDMAKSLAKGAEEGATFMYETAFGTEVAIPIDEETTQKDLKQAFNAAEMQAEANIMGEAFAAALANLNIDKKELQTSLSAAAEGLNVDVQARITSTYQEIQNAINGLGTFTIAANLALNNILGHAKGIKNSPNSHLALTGEEGPELVQTKTGYYITGQNGPEMAYINKGDTVYTASETRQILKGQKDIGPRYGDGITGYGDPFFTGGSGGSGAAEDGWESSIDKLYNLLRDIDEELRQRTTLERRYENLLNGLNTSAKDLINVSKQSLAQLEKERGLQEERIAGRNSQIDAYLQEKSEYNKYANAETDEWGNRVLRIDWQAIDAISNEEEGKNVEEYLSQLEEWFDDITDAEDALLEIEDAVQEIRDRGKDEYFSLEEQIKDAFVNSRQKEIDELSNINDSINDTNTRLLDAMQRQIDEARQARENEKTEQELSDKQRRLAYLQQDTSGANALEIMQLQKEIDEESEDYTDTLVDQKISELQKQNDDAAFQRQQQIDILQAQLDNYIESGAVWKDVYSLLNSGIDNDGIISGSDLETLLKDDANFAGMSELDKVEWLNELEDQVAQAVLWLQEGNQLENLEMEGQEIQFTNGEGQTLKGVVNKDGSVTTDTGETYKEVHRNYDGSYITSEKAGEKPAIEPEAAPEPEPAKPEITEDVLRGVASAIWRGDLGWGTGSERMSKLTEIFGADNAAKVKRYVDKKDYKQFDPSFSIAPEHSYSKMKEMFGTSGETYGSSYSNSYSGTNSSTESNTPLRASNTNGKPEDISNVSKDLNTGKITGTYNRYDPTTGQIEERQAYFNEAEKKWYYYKTGGLADFTGPAWLDGTKAHPEYVLNASQTSAFFNLVDVLESFRNGVTPKSSTENNGDTNYDIDINVESIGNDYDVEQLASTVKRLITDDARYRNNNTINLKR